MCLTLLCCSRKKEVPVDDKLSDTSEDSFLDPDDARTGWNDDDDNIVAKVGVKLGGKILDVDDGEDGDDSSKSKGKNGGKRKAGKRKAVMAAAAASSKAGKK